MIVVARVLIDSPLPQLDRLFDYEVPASLVADAVPGVRVRVPLRTAGRVVDGYLVEVHTAEAPERPLSELDAVVSSVPVLTPALYALARRAADRAAGSASDILRLVIPKRMVRAEKAWLAAGDADASAAEVSTDAAAWADGVLAAYPGLSGAVAAGERLALDAPPRPAPDRPVGAWADLVAAIAVRTLADGRSTVLVVPDHRDQDQLLTALAGRAPDDTVVRDDARRSGPERYATYLRLLTPSPCIVVGNRSTVYAPAHDTACVVVWDDGDPLLAEPLSPGVHARDAALLRQELEGSALVFAGHTRTTDVERLVQLGWVGGLLLCLLGGVALVRSWSVASRRRSIMHAWTPLIVVTLAVTSIFESVALVGFGWMLLCLCAVRAGQSRSWRDRLRVGAVPTSGLPEGG